MRGGLYTGWRLAWLALGWIGGSAAQLTRPEVLPAPLALGLAVAGMAAAWALRRRLPAAVLMLALAAFGLTDWRAGQRLADALPAALEGRDLLLTGVVSSLPRSSLNGTRFEFDVEQARWVGQADEVDQAGAAAAAGGGAAGAAPPAVPRRVSLGWYRGFDGTALLAAPQADLRAGDRWRFTVRLRRPHGTLNPDGFDFELWLFERGVRATGYVRATPSAVPERLGPAAGHAVLRQRQQLRDRIAARVDDPRAAGVLAALSVGDQGAIERADWELFRVTGVAHLMSISGLHVTMFAWLAAAVVGWAWRRSARLMLWLPAPLAARWGGLALATAYALLAGWGVPAQRTLGMLAVLVGLRSLGLRWPPLLALLAAGLAVTLGDPWALLQPGFWLSFVAVGLLMGSEPLTGAAAAPAGQGSGPWRARAARFAAALRGGLRTQVVATVGLAPLTLLFFQQLSVVGFVANLLAIPLVTLAVTPLALAGTLWPLLWQPAAALVQALSGLLGWMAAWPGAVWTAPAAPAWAAAAGLLGGALLVLPLPPRVRWLGLPLLLPLLLPPVPPPAPGRFEMVVVDVGQGTAVLLRTHTQLLVYDAGPAYSPESDAAERVLLPLLRARGERRVDTLVLSHRDSDHVGGAARLLQHLPVSVVFSSLEPAHALRDGAVPHETCAAGQQWEWDGVRFELLHPPAPLPPAARPNALSCVLRVQDARGASVLLTGDIEAAQESVLVVRQKAALRSTVLMVPHHGSRTSSSAAFLDAVAPDIAFVQAAYRSRFGHPAADVLARYAERGIAVRRSDACGAWVWPGEGAGQCERQRRARYWHHRP